MIETNWFVLLVAVVSVTLLALAAGFHFYWGFGGKVGRNVSVPQREDGTPVFTLSSLATHAVGLVIFIVIASVFFIPMARPSAITPNLDQDNDRFFRAHLFSASS